jgi:hypothetical protein
MLSRIDRIGSRLPVRRTARTAADRHDEADIIDGVSLPVVTGPAAPPPPDRRGMKPAVTELVAHIMGQEGERRGLRGGAPILDAARTAYNRVEWSGSYDRRSRKGRNARTDI